MKMKEGRYVDPTLLVAGTLPTLYLLAYTWNSVNKFQNGFVLHNIEPRTHMTRINRSLKQHLVSWTRQYDIYFFYNYQRESLPLPKSCRRLANLVIVPLEHRTFSFNSFANVLNSIGNTTMMQSPNGRFPLKPSKGLCGQAHISQLHSMIPFLANEWSAKQPTPSHR